ncbi:MAG: DUF1735 and LamG domain-containing protein [Bacteroidales bacterium]|nr:DUF1735 and LamG domain-containing protein [Bacteroides sp.]MCM1197709.1 DUF1735 and LamG domain-containing protein [Clostridium sp.]MCM1501444.1 DUF1735 and LamG domain-containing protein [Bacteroidales bacterium]
MKNIFKTGILALAALFAAGCDDAEYGEGGKAGDQLGVHAFFAESINSPGIASTLIKLTVNDGAKVVLTPALTDKLASGCSFRLVIDQSVLDAYNKSEGTGYQMFDESLVDLGGEINIGAGQYSADAAMISLDKIPVELSGMPLALPVRLEKINGDAEVASNTASYVFVITSPLVNDIAQFTGAAGLWVNDFEQTFDQFTIEMRLQVANTNNRNRDIFCTLNNNAELMFRFEDPQQSDGTDNAHSLIQFQGVGDYLNPASGQHISVNKWQHYAVTYDGTKVAIYVNGNKAGEKNITPKVVKDGYFPYLTFGGIGGFNGQWGPGDSYWYGCKLMVTECRIWSVCRTADQISKNIASVVPDTKGLEGYWRVSKATYNEETKEFADLTGKGHPMTTNKTFVWNENISTEDEATAWK